MKIVPAILADNVDDFLSRLRQAESFAEYVQIDLMDGNFVPTLSFPPEKINSIRTSLSFEMHLMVRHPSAYISTIKNPGLKKVIYHFESEVKHIDFIKQINDRGIQVGLAVKPETGLEEFRDIAERVDTVLFLTVDPGYYGSPFKPEVLDKIAETRKIFPRKTISVDGGVSLENLEEFLKRGVDYVCIGSRIFLGDDPAENYKEFLDKLSVLNK